MNGSILLSCWVIYKNIIGHGALVLGTEEKAKRISNDFRISDFACCATVQKTQQGHSFHLFF
jgi:hypothetical protein